MIATSFFEVFGIIALAAVVSGTVAWFVAFTAFEQAMKEHYEVFNEIKKRLDELERKSK